MCDNITDSGTADETFAAPEGTIIIVKQICAAT
jgi:hypothetical protein